MSNCWVTFHAHGDIYIPRPIATVLGLVDADRVVVQTVPPDSLVICEAGLGDVETRSVKDAEAKGGNIRIRVTGFIDQLGVELPKESRPVRFGRVPAEHAWGGRNGILVHVRETDEDTGAD